MTSPAPTARRLLVPAIAGALCIVIALLLDRWAYGALVYPPVHERDWGRLLRAYGSLVFWLPLAIAVWLARRAGDRPQANQAWLLVLIPALSGLVAEVLKILVRRDRPGLHDGAFVFRPWSDRFFYTSPLGMPSSHAMVAFAGAAVLARLFPGTAPVAYVLAAGSALTRVLSRGHFLSDVVVGGVAGWAVGAFLWTRFAGRRRTVASSGHDVPA